MRTRMVVVLGLVLAVGLTGCAKAGKKPGVATAGKGGTSASPNAADNLTTAQKVKKYADCVRANGVPNFPDPKVNDDGGVLISAPEGIDQAKMEAAQQKCQKYLPDAGAPTKINAEQLKQMRAQSQCMRDHGVKNFPDPDADGKLTIDSSKLGVDPNSDTFKAAAKACEKYGPARPSGAPAGGSITQPGGGPGAQPGAGPGTQGGK